MTTGTSRPAKAAVRHAALAAVQLSFRQRGHSELAISGTGAYEYGTSRPLAGITPRPLPDG